MLVVIGIAGQKENLQFFFQFLQLRPELGELLVGEFLKFLILAFQYLFGFGEPFK